MPILKPPPKPLKNETLQVRIEKAIKSNVHRYAEFIGSSESYVVSEALKLLFRKDDEFKEWLNEHTDDAEQPQNDGTLNLEATNVNLGGRPLREDRPLTAWPQANR